MDVSVAGCRCRGWGAELGGRSSDARFGDDTCRKRYSRRGPEPVEKVYLLADAPQQSGLTSERQPLPKIGPCQDQLAGLLSCNAGK